MLGGKSGFPLIGVIAQYVVESECTLHALSKAWRVAPTRGCEWTLALAEQSASSPARSDILDSEDDNDMQSNPGGYPLIPQTGMSQSAFIRLMETMLHKALKTTSDQITNSLTREIRELGQRTADLETSG